MEIKNHKIIVKHLNNHVQKGAIILVTAMLLSAPNLYVYSSVGNYQTSSSAITANNYYPKLTHGVEKPSFPGLIDMVAFGGIIIGVMGVAVIASSRFTSIQPTFLYIVIDDNYAKHDFSEFDN